MVDGVVWKDNCVLPDASFNTATLKNTEFGEGGRINLARTDFTNATMNNVTFHGGDGVGLVFANVKAEGVVTFKGTHLAGADFRDSFHANLKFDNAKLDWAILKLPPDLVQNIKDGKVTSEAYNWNVGETTDAGAIVVRSPTKKEIDDKAMAADVSVVEGLVHRGPQLLSWEDVNANTLAERLAKMSTDKKLEAIVTALKLNAEEIDAVVRHQKESKTADAAKTLKDSLLKSKWKFHVK